MELTIEVLIEMAGVNEEDVVSRLEKNTGSTTTYSEEEVALKGREALMLIPAKAEMEYLSALVIASNYSNSDEQILNLASKIGAVESLSTIWKALTGEELAQKELLLDLHKMI